MKNKNDIIWFKETDSTNEEARRRISYLDNLSVLSALSQTSGKGQRGNTWLSEPGRNLLFSIILKLDGDEERFQAYDQFAISEAAALTIVDFLSGHGVAAKIKWPNDIYVGNKKICGILIENNLRGKWLNSSIIGIGLNINQTKFDDTLKNPTSVLLETGKELNIEECLDEITDIFRNYCNRYLHINGGLANLRRLYLGQMWKIGEPFRFYDVSENRIFVGTITGMDEVGNLLVMQEDGETKSFGFKEIIYSDISQQ